jgi:asparagine synthetase B (glutamine-hydrolysing)
VVPERVAATEQTHGVENEFGFVPRFQFEGKEIGSGRLVDAVARSGGVTLDFDALNVFLRTDMFLEGATPFKEVRRFSPPPVIIGPSTLSHEQTIEGYGALFQQAVARRATPNSVVALSGGRDSRHILLELHAQGRLPRYALTVALESTEDRALAEVIARAVGVPLVIEPQEESILGMRQTIRANDLMSTEHSWLASVASRRDDSAWWDGIGGDVLSAGMDAVGSGFLSHWNVRLFEEGRLDELADGLVRQGPVPYFRDLSLFRRDDAVAAVYAELQRHVDAANPVGSFYFWNRTRVAIGAMSFALLRPAWQPVLAPYLDRDLWRFLSAVPMRLLCQHKLHDQVIRRMYPFVREVPFALKYPVRVSAHRRRALRMLTHLVTRRPRIENLQAAARLLRSILIPSRAADVEWIVASWAYGDTITGLASPSL